MNKAVFLDRDGVINKDKGYLFKIEDFEFIEGIFDLCKRFVDLGYCIIVVSNQSGIGRGYYTEEDFERLTDWMCERFEENGVPILDVKYCPYHPTEGIGSYKKESPYRKPGPQMILDAAQEHDINLSESLMIGDKASDAQAAQAAGIKTAFLLCGNYAVQEMPGVTIYSSLSALMDVEFK